MINIRYHIFSLVAVFAALAIGLAAGTTVVRGPLVDSLRQNLDRVEARNESVRKENFALSKALDQAHVLDDDGGALLVGRAVGTPVLLITVDGVEHSAVDGIIKSFANAGAIVAGRIEIKTEPGLIGPQISAAVSAARSALFTATIGEPITLSVVLKSELGVALDDGQVSVSNANVPITSTGLALRVVVITDRNDSKFDWVVFISEILHGLTSDLTAPIPVLAEVDKKDPLSDLKLGSSVVSAVRNDSTLQDLVSTVDSVMHFPGWAATVLATEASVSRVAQHLGLQEGSEGLLTVIK